jgi:hypothetical protein
VPGSTDIPREVAIASMLSLAKEIVPEMRG